MNQAISWAAMGTGFTFLMTARGAGVVFIFKKDMGKNIQRACRGFAAGVMMAASVWSLLIPAIDETRQAGGIAWIPAAGVFVLGGLFIYLLDLLMPHLHLGEAAAEGVRSPAGLARMPDGRVLVGSWGDNAAYDFDFSR